jgi:nicotinamide-nucleotide amidase
MTATIITIGDEILVGQTVDTNSTWIAFRLNQIGIPVREILSISDKEDAIREALDRATQKSELVILTGGLGPTKDDITKHVLVNYFGDELVLDHEVLTRIEDYFKSSNRPMLEVNRLQAMLPKKAAKIQNDLGTAAGMWFEKGGCQVISMPGVPYEMKGLMEKIIPVLQQKFRLADFFHRTILFQGIGEAQLAEDIKDLEESCLERGIAVAYLPSTGLVKLRLTSFEKDASFIEGTLSTLRARFPKLVYGFENDTLESVIGHVLRDQNQTLGTIESCTGGALAARIVSVSGSSAWYNGTVVSYSNAIKEQLVGVAGALLETSGAVSQEAVEEMAKKGRILLRSDYCIATSGIAGPDGGSPEKPVGLVWIGISGADGTYSKKFLFRQNRERNIESTVVYALNFLRQIILKLQ